jgi:putative endonuclease
MRVSPVRLRPCPPAFARQVSGKPVWLRLASQCGAVLVWRRLPAEAFAKAGLLCRGCGSDGGKAVVLYVYIIQSIPHPDQYYVGVSADFSKRLAKHNAGDSPHTSKYKPWRFTVVLRFEDDDHAIAFERYLKSGSGRAFAGRHFR